MRISGPLGAATKLGLPARTLDSKIKRFKINKYRFKVPGAVKGEVGAKGNDWKGERSKMT